ncbi:hypothetical protein [Roseiflexus sp.]|uniref:hypothetical protein n=1 Tax=Roseiflexus sp. TaxID=2562120 RepID=UPI0025F4F59C|nr:hypothetical protein [Roseiflexus sp.]
MQHARDAAPVAPGSVVPLALVILSLVLGARLARLDQHLTVDDPDARRVLVGFYDVERNPTDLFRWSRPEAALFLFGFDGRPAQVMLRFAAPRGDADPPVLSVSMRGRAVGTFSVAPGWRRYYLLTPTDPAGDTPLLLRTAAYRPPGDGRDLGVVLAEFAALPSNDAVWFPPPVRAIFLASFPVLGWLALLWRALRQALERQLLRWSVVVFLALLAGAAAAFPRVSGYWLPTIWMALVAPAAADAGRCLATDASAGDTQRCPAAFSGGTGAVGRRWSYAGAGRGAAPWTAAGGRDERVGGCRDAGGCGVWRVCCNSGFRRAVRIPHRGAGAGNAHSRGAGVAPLSP